MKALVWQKGSILSPEEAKVSVFDRGFLFGDGVYETGRSYGRAFLSLDAHWRRLRQSAAKLAIPLPWSDAELTAAVFETARRFDEPDLYFRTIVSRGVVESVGLEAPPRGEPTLVHLVQRLPESAARQRTSGLRLVTSKILRNSSRAQDPNIKTSNYLNSLLALQDARARGGEDAILLTAEGIVAEGTTFSVFGVRENGTLITPALEVGILDSLTRRHVLELAGPLCPVAQGFFPLAEFLACREAFVVSSVRDITPVLSWDDKVFPAPGPTTARLTAAFDERIRALAARQSSY